MNNKPLFQLGWKDVLKGFILTVVTIVLTGLVTSLSAGKLPDMETLKSLLYVGLSAGVSYLLKNLLTNSDDKFLKSENDVK